MDMELTGLPALGNPCVVTTLDFSSPPVRLQESLLMTGENRFPLGVYVPACACPWCLHVLMAYLSPIFSMCRASVSLSCLFIYAANLSSRRFKGTYKDT